MSKTTNKNAFPIVATASNGSFTAFKEGMTYRDWLIGQIASGAVTVQMIKPEDAAKRIIKLADAIIDELEKEK
jgi:ArsR family metal-binding transcriptional regulator